MPNSSRIADDMRRIEELIRQIEAAADPQWHALAVELVRVLMDLHCRAIARMLAIVAKSGEAGTETVQRFSRDDLVGQLLMLYDLHPVDLERRVAQGLEKVRPLLNSHGGDVGLVGIEDGIVRLRLDGSCDGCSSSSLRMKLAIEEAVYEAAADAAGVEIVGSADEPPPSGFVPLETLQMGR